MHYLLLMHTAVHQPAGRLPCPSRAVVDTPLLPLTPEELFAGTTLPQPGSGPAQPPAAGQSGAAGANSAGGSASGCVPTVQLFQTTPEFSAWARMVNSSGVLVRAH